MAALFAISMMGSILAAGWLAFQGNGIWAIPLIVVAAGCGKFFMRAVSRRRFAVADVPSPRESAEDGKGT